MPESAPIGRPTEYKPEFAEMLLEYFAIEPTKIEQRIIEGVECEVQVTNPLPTLAGFACQIGFHRGTLWDWSEKYPEFADAYKKAKDHQERILAENGLMGRYEKAFAIFTAKNVIGWKDKVDHDHRHSGKISLHFDRDDENA